MINSLELLPKRLLPIMLSMLVSVASAQPAGKLSGTPQEKAAQKANQAQYRSRQALVEHCEREAKAAQAQSVKHPAKVTPYPVAYKRCMELRRSK